MGLVSVYYQSSTYNARKLYVKSVDNVEIGIPISVSYKRLLPKVRLQYLHVLFAGPLLSVRGKCKI